MFPLEPPQEYVNHVYHVVLRNLRHIKYFQLFVNHIDDNAVAQQHTDSIARAIVMNYRLLTPPFHIEVRSNFNSKQLIHFTYG